MKLLIKDNNILLLISIFFIIILNFISYYLKFILDNITIFMNSNGIVFYANKNFYFILLIIICSNIFRQNNKTLTYPHLIRSNYHSLIKVHIIYMAILTILLVYLNLKDYPIGDYLYIKEKISFYSYILFFCILLYAISDFLIIQIMTLCALLLLTGLNDLFLDFQYKISISLLCFYTFIAILDHYSESITDPFLVEIIPLSIITFGSIIFFIININSNDIVINIDYKKLIITIIFWIFYLLCLFLIYKVIPYIYSFIDITCDIHLKDKKTIFYLFFCISFIFLSNYILFIIIFPFLLKKILEMYNKNDVVSLINFQLDLLSSFIFIIFIISIKYIFINYSYIFLI